MGIFFQNLVHFEIANLAKSEPAFQISPAKCAGKLRYPKEGFCNYMKKGKVEGRHESVDGLLLILLGVEHDEEIRVRREQPDQHCLGH